MSRVIENPQELILGKAKEILSSEGYSKLSMRSIAKACDIALGTIYNYYPTKKELVIEMMTDYWREYFRLLEKVIQSEDELYKKLRRIFHELKGFIEKFKAIWLKPELYDKPDYVECGVEKEYIYFEKLFVEIEKLLLKESEINNISLKQNAYETSKFIVMNFITMIQMPVFQYDSFQVFLKELLE